MGMIEEVVVTEQMFQISASDAAALFQLTDYVFEMEGKGIDGEVAVELANALLRVTDKLRMSGARDTAKWARALVLAPETTLALRNHLETLTPNNPFVHIEEVQMTLGALSRAKAGESATLDEDELERLTQIAKCSALNAAPGLEGLRARLEALSQPV